MLRLQWRVYDKILSSKSSSLTEMWTKQWLKIGHFEFNSSLFWYVWHHKIFFLFERAHYDVALFFFMHKKVITNEKIAPKFCGRQFMTKSEK